MSAAAALSGVGSVSQSAAGALSALATLSGTSTVSQSGTGSLAAAAALSGAGGVTQSGTGALSASAALSGSSTVSQAGTGSLSATATLTGSGTVASSVTLKQKGDTGASLIVNGAAGTILPGNSTSGNTVVACITVLGSGLAGNNITSITSSIGTFTKLNSQPDTPADSDCEQWVCLSASGAATTITPVFGGTGTVTHFIAAGFEWTPGASAATTGGTGNGNSTSPAQTVSPGTTGYVVMVMNSDYNAITAAPGAPWTTYNGSTQWSHTDGNDVAWQITASSSSVTATWTITNSAPNYWTCAGMYLHYP